MRYRYLILLGFLTLAVTVGGIFLFIQNNRLKQLDNNIVTYSRILQNPELNPDGSSLVGNGFVDFRFVDIENQDKSELYSTAAFKLAILFKLEDCASCLHEYRLWSKIYQAYPSALLFVFGVCSSPDRDAIKEFIKERRIDFPIIWDPDNDIARRMKARSSPLKYFLNKERKIVSVRGPLASIIEQEQYSELIDNKVAEYHRMQNSPKGER